MNVDRATQAKRLSMMALMVGAMVLHNRVEQHTLVLAVATAVCAVIAIYGAFVALVLRREGADQNTIARTILSGVLPMISRPFLSRSR